MDRRRPSYTEMSRLLVGNEEGFVLPAVAAVDLLVFPSRRWLPEQSCLLSEPLTSLSIPLLWRAFLDPYHFRSIPASCVLLGLHPDRTCSPAFLRHRRKA